MERKRISRNTTLPRFCGAFYMWHNSESHKADRRCSRVPNHISKNRSISHDAPVFFFKTVAILPKICYNKEKPPERGKTVKLLLNALIKFTVGLLFVGVLLFLPAGSFSYMNAWLFIGLLFVPMLILGAILLFKAPHLLEKRLNAKETENTQKGVVAVSACLFLGGFIVAGLDFRFGWSHIPLWGVVIASVVLLVSYALYAEVMRENAYLSRTVEVQESQTVVDTGLYGIVRHPMYAATVWLFLSIPVVLGSLWSLLCFAPYVAVIVVRIRNEEKVLTEGLAGYEEYKKRVRYRLIPWIW